MSNVSSDSQKGATRSLTLDLDAFALEALEAEASQMAVSIEELARFAPRATVSARLLSCVPVDASRLCPDGPAQHAPRGRLGRRAD